MRSALALVLLLSVKPSEPLKGTLLVAHKAGDALSFVDLASKEVVRTVPVGRAPHELAISPDGRTVLVPEYGPEGDPGRTLAILDVAEARITGRIDLGERSRPHSAAFLPDGKRAVVTLQDSDLLALLDLESREVRRRIPTGGRESHMVRLDPAGRRAYVTSRLGSGTLSVVDLEKDQAAIVIPTGAGAEGLAVTPDGAEVWVLDRAGGTISIVDAKSLEVTDRLPARPSSNRIEISHRGEAIVTNGTSGQELVSFADLYDVTSRERLGEWPIHAGEASRGAFGILVEAERAFVSDTRGGRILVFSLERFDAPEVLLEGLEGGPDGMVWTPHRLEKEGEEASGSWDVNAPFGPTTELDFETNEGTWMNLDVSPDGGTLVFDLLGDLYRMPVEGTGEGLATRITSGAAFDMQPRFSPDGSLIAFASDRDGATNLWVVKLDGSEPRQVSKEKRWFVNSPVWSPDGQYLFARHHFVKERSLGAGEIWMYHLGGSAGLQVTEKASFQKDAGEPTVSPDGRYLYYSKDVTPGDQFEYNKDPNTAIYAVVRRDLLTGEERREVSIQGGAVAPRISPDGKRLAFIRRVRLQSLLHLQDLETGESWPVFDQLDKDLQEAWAIHGLYPGYSWSPDGRHIFIWGLGKIWKVDVEARSGVAVPFRARIQQAIHDAVRFPQKVHADEFPVRMLRHASTSPEGTEVVYSALGRLYRKELPDGEAVRLTADELIEHAPSFSPDGAFIVYATWSDEDKGRIRLVRPDGTGGRELVAEPGHTTEPSFSPDGSRVVYRRTRGDSVRGQAFGTDPGIYLLDVAGGDPRLVTESGQAPRFAAGGDRIVFVDRRGEKTVLASVNLEGGEEVVHLESDNALEIVPSPDDRFVAFVERFRVHVAPFPRTGRPVTLGPDTTSVPVVAVSTEAGSNLHWSGDAKTLYWTLGPELFSISVEPLFAGGGGSPPEPEKASIGFSVASDVPRGSLALLGARVVTLAENGPPAIDEGTVIVEGNRITAVGPSGSVRIPEGARRIDAAGRTIIPGLIDVHAHVGSESQGILAEQSWALVANLAYGVTTSHDPSNNTEMVFTNAEMIRAGTKLGPRLFSTGTILYGAETPFKAAIEKYEDALFHLKRLKAAGAFSVKSYNQQRRDVRQMIVKAARELQMMVVPEGGSLLYMDETFVHDGHTGLEHSLPVPRLYRDVVELFAKSGTGYTPTLIVGYGGLSGEYYWYQHTKVWENEQLLQFIPREIVDARSRRRTMAEEDDFNHVLIAQGAKRILDAGGRVQLGAHGQLQGLGAHWELWMLVQGGMTPLEALRAATLDGAKYLGLDSELGSIEPGKLADLVVLSANPLDDVRNSERVVQVMVNGRLYEAATMNEMGSAGRRRRPFYWQR